ncbi:hypothetical protein TCDM_07541 [Trypanosoma cruzi Dm28c]|uniref:Uncharacterized protein n=1 Tax=Trypanosoma cruzi Dm28c TaxID=1416333 RepID=V5BIS5_TRYCR|nr:hypothetical protein TCDM_07541 [Trypanosoma cruzi Dm28c]
MCVYVFPEIALPFLILRHIFTLTPTFTFVLCLCVCVYAYISLYLAYFIGINTYLYIYIYLGAFHCPFACVLSFFFFVIPLYIYI